MANKGRDCMVISAEQPEMMDIEPRKDDAL